MRFGECDSEHWSSIGVGEWLWFVVYAPMGPGASFSEAPFFRSWIRKCVCVCVCVCWYFSSGVFRGLDASVSEREGWVPHHSLTIRNASHPVQPYPITRPRPHSWTALVPAVPLQSGPLGPPRQGGHAEPRHGQDGVPGDGRRQALCCMMSALLGPFVPGGVSGCRPFSSHISSSETLASSPFRFFQPSGQNKPL